MKKLRREVAKTHRQSVWSADVLTTEEKKNKEEMNKNPSEDMVRWLKNPEEWYDLTIFRHEANLPTGGQQRAGISFWSD